MILHKATIIDELEVTMPRCAAGVYTSTPKPASNLRPPHWRRWLESRFKGSWYPGWIHVLRVDLDRVDKPNLGTMWVDAGAAEVGAVHACCAAAVPLHAICWTPPALSEIPGALWLAVQGDGKAADTSGLEAKLAEMQSQLNRMEALLGRRCQPPAAPIEDDFVLQQQYHWQRYSIIANPEQRCNFLMSGKCRLFCIT
jgi:hypothetical protein